MPPPRPIPRLLPALLFCLTAGWALWAAQVLKDDQGVEFSLPADWPQGLPAPRIKSNCVRCHVNEAAKLAAPARDFAAGAHDRAELSCESCHGGDTENDALAHETGFVKGTAKLMARCSTCHRRENRAFTASAHFRRDFPASHPVCATCHDVHANGKRRPELAAACAQCHPGGLGAGGAPDPKVAPYASLLAESDALWSSLARMRALGAADPEDLAPEIKRVRARTMELFHASAAAPDAAKVKEAAEASRELKTQIQDYLSRPPAPQAP